MKSSISQSAGALSRLPIRRFRWMVGLQGFIALLLLALTLWWSVLIAHQFQGMAELEKRIVALQGDGAAMQIDWDRKRRMWIWESGSFVVLILGSFGLLTWLYRREWNRARAMHAFFASLTHELRTPVASIRLQAESLSEDVPRDASFRPLLDRLHEDVERLQFQVQRTLELARVEGGGELRLQDISLRPWLERWRKSLPSQVRAVLDPESVQVFVRADSTALELVLRNLVENSIRHGGGTTAEPLEVRVQWARVGSQRVLIQYADAGVGAEVSARLGDLFQRGARSQGAGVGLFLVRSLILAMGGRVEYPGGKGFPVRVELEGGADDGH